MPWKWHSEDNKSKATRFLYCKTRYNTKYCKKKQQKKKQRPNTKPQQTMGATANSEQTAAEPPP